jgi:cation diffusion facilitator family transporter
MNKKSSVALSSVFASALLTFIKLFVGLLTGSIGILSEAAHSLLDLGAAALTFFAVRIGDKPPDKVHPYGHGKVESISALIETGLLFLTSAWIIYEAVKRLLVNKVEIEVTWYAFAVMIVSIIVDFSRSRALSRIAKETKSQALEADALHFSSDIYSSTVVIIGLIVSLFGVNKADAIAAIGVSLFVLHAGYVLGKRTIDVLVDAAPAGLSEEIMGITQKTKGVLNVPRIRVRPVGASVFVELIIEVARSMPFGATKLLISTITKNIKNIIPEADITIQAKPIALNNETLIEQVKIIADSHRLSVHDIVVHEQKEKRIISFDLEVDAQTQFEKAHAIATHLENALQKEFGSEIEVNVHIEPLKKNMIRGETVSPGKQKKIEEIINAIAKNIPLVKEIHTIKIQSIGAELFVSFHCSFDNGGTLEQIHYQTSTMEYLIRRKIPEIKKVLIHAEPFSVAGH